MRKVFERCRQLLAMVLALLLLTAPVAGLSESARVSQSALSWMIDRDGLETWLTLLGSNTETASDVATILSGLLGGLTVTASYWDEGADVTIRMQDEALADLSLREDEDGHILIGTSFLPGLVMYADGNEVVSSLNTLNDQVEVFGTDDFLNEFTQALLSDLMPPITDFVLAHLPVTEEGRFFGNAYGEGDRIRTYRAEEKEVCEFAQKLLGANVWSMYGDNVAGVLSIVSEAFDAGIRQNRYLYELSLVYQEEELLGLGLTVNDRLLGGEVMTLSVANPEDGIMAVWSLGMNNQMYHVELSMDDSGTDDDRFFVTSKVRLFDDAYAIGYRPLYNWNQDVRFVSTGETETMVDGDIHRAHSLYELQVISEEEQHRLLEEIVASMDANRFRPEVTWDWTDADTGKTVIRATVSTIDAPMPEKTLSLQGEDRAIDLINLSPSEQQAVSEAADLGSTVFLQKLMQVIPTDTLMLLLRLTN
ncbi:MAG: hypothetical protein IJ083_03585 [Clostridia bacterium]|nr:hypothetical protein [Clostridia bacterium]